MLRSVNILRTPIFQNDSAWLLNVNNALLDAGYPLQALLWVMGCLCFDRTCCVHKCKCNFARSNYWNNAFGVFLELHDMSSTRKLDANALAAAAGM